MKYSCVKSSDIEVYIRNDRFKKIHTEIINILKIDELNCKINLHDEDINQDGYKLTGTLGQTIFKDQLTQVEGIRLFTNNIIQHINLSYSRIPEPSKYVLIHILEIFVNFIVIHELTHISQFKKGQQKELKYLTESKHDITKYRDSLLEKEANTNAYNYLKEIDEFYTTISLDLKKMFEGHNVIDYEVETAESHAVKLIDLYHKVYDFK